MNKKLFSSEAIVTQYCGHTEYAKTAYKSGFHNGLDVKPINIDRWELYSPCDLEIMETGRHLHYGKYIIGHNLFTGARFRFAHLEKISVNKGQVVLDGDLIGVCGNTGNSTGRHLHLDLMYMMEYGKPDFVYNNPLNGYSDPLSALKELGVHI